LRLYSEKDYGIYDALNKGIAIAKGDFVYVLGLDDYIESPNNMALAYNFAIDGNYDITISPVKLSNGVVVPVKKKDIFNSYYKMAFCHQGVLCRTVTLLNLKGFEGLYRFISDWLFLYTAIAAGGRIKYFDKVFCVYGITGCSSKQIFFAEQEQLECLMKIYPRARKDVVKYGIIPSMDIFKLLITRSSFAKKCGLRALKKKMFLKVKHKGYKTFYILGHKVLNFCRKTHLFK
jgi:glycosyltransferase involved in cell wall biosynthesis